MSNIYTHNTYYQDHLDKNGISLKNHYEIGPLEKQLDINYKDFLQFAEDNRHRAITDKEYKPRPFLTDESMRQAVLSQFIGYGAGNTLETNWGIEPEDDAKLKELLGDANFEEMNLVKETSLVRLLQYNPGHGIPLHTDSYNGFMKRFGPGNITRYFVAISPWDWGHFLQVHDNMIHHWDPGYALEVKEGVWHLSGNFGIAPKYTLTVTGYVND